MRANFLILRVLLLLLVVFLPKSIQAQYYSTGQDCSQYKWKEIETEYFRLIFPSFYETKALQVASYCDTFASINKKEFGIPLRKKQSKTPLILHVGGSRSNGVSVWAPKRIEFWTCPDQDSYSQPWLQQLVLHEFRHELQIEALNQKALGIGTSIFGEHVVGLATGLFVPQWFLEGDAVYAETQLSKCGRGRKSEFLTPAQVLICENENYTYHKNNFGSYKDYTMDSYLLGYLLVSYDRKKIDSLQCWTKGLENIAENFWKLTPFYQYCKIQNEYDSAMTFWKNRWNNLFEDTSYITEYQLNKVQKEYTNYYTIGKNDSLLFVLKNGLREASGIFTIDSNGNEKKLFNTGAIYDNFVAQKGKNLAWIEVVTNPRWNMYYNNLVVYDHHKKVRKTLTKKRNIFSPCFSGNGTLACLENQCDTANVIIFFDSTFKELPFQIKLPQSFEYQYPTLSATGDSLFIFALNENGKCILLIDNLLQQQQDSCNIKQISQAVFHNLSKLKICDNELLYISDLSGFNRVVCLKNGDEKIVSGNRYGIDNFAIINDGKHLIYNHFTKKGHCIYLDSIFERNIQTSKNTDIFVYSKPNAQDIKPLPTNLKSIDYSHTKHFFNFHGWLPLYFNTSSYDMGLGISVFSQNELTNSILNSTFKWDYNEQSPSLSVQYQYLRYYPKINMSANIARHHIESNGEKYLYDQVSLNSGLSIPYSIIHYNHIFRFNFGAGYSFSELYFVDLQNFTQPYMNSLKASFSFTHSTTRPSQYLYTPWYQSLTMQVAYGFGNTHEISSLGIAGTFYFPSPIETHSIRLYAGIQNKLKGLFSFSNIINIPRGFRYQNLNDIASSFQVNYSFPIAYPDLAIGNWAYLKRLHANIFLDGIFLDINDFQKSLGVELYLNTNVLLISTPISLGGRISYLPDNKSFNYDFLFSINL